MSTAAPIFDGPIVVLDTETTGFLKEPTAVPVELGAVLLNRWGIGLACFSSLIRPAVDDARHDETWTWHTEHRTGLTRALVQEAPSAADVVGAFDRWLEVWGHPKLTAFNVAYDRPMLERIGFTVPGELWAPCVMLEACQVMGEAGALPRNRGGSWKWPKAEEAMEFFGVKGVHRHRALADAKDEAVILVSMRRHQLRSAA